MPSPSPACVEVADYSPSSAWPLERARACCEQLEAGKILYFRQPSFDLPAADREFLVGQRQSGSSLHKNISYKPRRDALHGAAADDSSRARLHQVMRDFSSRVTAFLDRFLAPYRQLRQLDFASFRPLEEAGRPLPLHKRNDLLHVDAFPTRPTRGGRILRVFTNISPDKRRVWLTGEAFHQFASRLAPDAGLDRFTGKAPLSESILRALHLAPHRAAYDRFMLHFHDWLKENESFQRDAVRVRTEFPPFSTWLVFTDGVPHAVLSGQYALEQTLIIPAEALVAPQLSPIRVLESLCGQSLK